MHSKLLPRRRSSEIRLRSRDFLRSHPDLSFERTGVEKTEVSTLTFSSLEWTLALEVRPLLA
jgi:hypothetical protein